MAAPDDLAAYLDWCAQEADGEVPPLSYREWCEARGARAQDDTCYDEQAAAAAEHR